MQLNVNHLPGVIFGQTTLAKGDGDELEKTSGAELDGRGPRCFGLLLSAIEHNGLHRLRLTGRTPRPDSQSKGLFRVAHAIFVRYTPNTNTPPQETIDTLPNITVFISLNNTIIKRSICDCCELCT